MLPRHNSERLVCPSEASPEIEDVPLPQAALAHQQHDFGPILWIGLLCRHDGCGRLLNGHNWMR